MLVHDRWLHRGWLRYRNRDAFGSRRESSVSSVVSVVVCRWLAVATGLYINRGMMFRRPWDIYYDRHANLLCFLLWIAWCATAVQLDRHIEGLALDLEGLGLAGILHLAVFLKVVDAFGVQVPA